jgi:hypothetical protein
MEVTPEQLRDRYGSSETEELAEIYHAGGLTDLGITVLKEVIESRGMTWSDFAKAQSDIKEPDEQAEAEVLRNLIQPEWGQLTTEVETRQSVTSTNKSILWRLWNGQIHLVYVYWAVWVAGGGFVSFLGQAVTLESGNQLIGNSIFYAYVLFAAVVVLRSAKHYTGKVIWRILAQASVSLSLGFLVLLVLAEIILLIE